MYGSCAGCNIFVVSFCGAIGQKRYEKIKNCVSNIYLTVCPLEIDSRRTRPESVPWIKGCLKRPKIRRAESIGVNRETSERIQRKIRQRASVAACIYTDVTISVQP